MSFSLFGAPVLFGEEGELIRYYAVLHFGMKKERTPEAITLQGFGGEKGIRTLDTF
jgi:hypothetical protein